MADGLLPLVPEDDRSLGRVESPTPPRGRRWFPSFGCDASVVASRRDPVRPEALCLVEREPGCAPLGWSDDRQSTRRSRVGAVPVLAAAAVAMWSLRGQTPLDGFVHKRTSPLVDFPSGRPPPRKLRPVLRGARYRTMRGAGLVCCRVATSARARFVTLGKMRMVSQRSTQVRAHLPRTSVNTSNRSTNRVVRCLHLRSGLGLAGQGCLCHSQVLIVLRRKSCPKTHVRPLAMCGTRRPFRGVFLPYDALRSGQRPAPGLPHPAVRRLQVFSTS
jgi:hypothetical protein